MAANNSAFLQKIAYPAASLLCVSSVMFTGLNMAAAVDDVGKLNDGEKKVLLDKARASGEDKVTLTKDGRLLVTPGMFVKTGKGLWASEIKDSSSVKYKYDYEEKRVEAEGVSDRFEVYVTVKAEAIAPFELYVPDATTPVDNFPSTFVQDKILAGVKFGTEGRLVTCGENPEACESVKNPDYKFVDKKVDNVDETQSGEEENKVDPPAVDEKTGENGETDGENETPAVTIVDPEKPSFNDSVSEDMAEYTIPAQKGVQFKVNGRVKRAGTYKATRPEKINIEAVAETGYGWNEGATTTWSHSFKQIIKPLKPILGFTEESFDYPQILSEPDNPNYKYVLGATSVTPGAITYNAKAVLTDEAKKSDLYVLDNDNFWEYSFTDFNNWRESFIKGKLTDKADGDEILIPGKTNTINYELNIDNAQKNMIQMPTGTLFDVELQFYNANNEKQVFKNTDMPKIQLRWNPDKGFELVEGKGILSIKGLDKLNNGVLKTRMVVKYKGKTFATIKDTVNNMHVKHSGYVGAMVTGMDGTKFVAQKKNIQLNAIADLSKANLIEGKQYKLYTFVARDLNKNIANNEPANLADVLDMTGPTVVKDQGGKNVIAMPVTVDNQPGRIGNSVEFTYTGEPIVQKLSNVDTSIYSPGQHLSVFYYVTGADINPIMLADHSLDSSSAYVNSSIVSHMLIVDPVTEDETGRAYIPDTVVKTRTNVYIRGVKPGKYRIHSTLMTREGTGKDSELVEYKDHNGAKVEKVTEFELEKNNFLYANMLEFRANNKAEDLFISHWLENVDEPGKIVAQYSDDLLNEDAAIKAVKPVMNVKTTGDFAKSGFLKKSDTVNYSITGDVKDLVSEQTYQLDSTLERCVDGNCDSLYKNSKFVTADKNGIIPVEDKFMFSTLADGSNVSYQWRLQLVDSNNKTERTVIVEKNSGSQVDNSLTARVAQTEPSKLAKTGVSMEIAGLAGFMFMLTGLTIIGLFRKNK